MTYTPEDHGVGIVHIGPGAFHRAHQAVYTDTALTTEGGDWRIEAVSLQSRGTIDALNARQGRYTLVVRGGPGPDYREITSIARGLARADGAAPILAAIARPTTRIVSLTVTEKAYRKGDTVPLIADGLRQRQAEGAGGLTLLSCDNLPDNGAVLRAALLAEAPDLAGWIDDHVRCPSSMVDRITPASDAALLVEVRAATGRDDPLAVATEAFSQWVIEDRFAAGRPAWEAGGALLVTDVEPYERMKLRMLNGAHSMLAYAGFLAGHQYVRDVMADAGLARLVARHMAAAAGTLSPLPQIDYAEYATALTARFENPHIAHETYQIAMDGSQKMPQRIFAPALDALSAGQPLQPFAFATAAWARYLRGRAEDGTAYALRDPRAADLIRGATGTAQDQVGALFAMADLVPGALAASDAFRAAVTTTLARMLDLGIAGAIDQEQ